MALFKKGVEVPIENEFRCSEHGRTCEAIRLPEGAGPEDFCLIKMKGSLARRGAAYRASNGQEVELPWNARPVAGYHGEEVPAAVAAVAAMLVVETPVAQPAKQPAEQPQQPQQQQQASAEQQKQSATVAARPAKARMSEDESLLCMRIYWSYLEFFDSKRFKLLTQPVPFTYVRAFELI